MTARWASIVLVIVCLALYGRSIDFGFVRADDTDLIEGNAEFLSSLANIPRAFGRSFFESANVLTDVRTYYRPLTVVSFMVDAAIGGSNPAIYHATNVALHALVVVLLFVLLRHGTSTSHVDTNGTRHMHRHRGIGTAFGAALIFAVHPANVQTVCWIMGRNELLLAAFSLIAFASFLRVSAASDVGRSFSFVPAVVHVLAFAGAVFSKETGVVLLPLFVLCPAAVAQTFRFAETGSEGLRYDRFFWRILALDTAVAAVWWGMRGAALAGGPSGDTLAWRTIVANAPQLFSYLEKIIFPFRLSTMPGVDRWTLLLGSLGAVLIVVVLIRTLGLRLSTFAAAWFAVFLVPALLVPGLPAYEHRLYVPLIGLALGFGLWTLGQQTTPIPQARRAKSPKPKVQSLLAVLVIAAVFFVISFRYAGSFRTPLAYWSRATESSQFAPIAHVNVGQLLQDARQPQEAAAHFRRALDIDPRTPKAHNNLGVALMQLGRRPEAFEAFSAEIRLHYWNADAHYNLGLMYEEEGRLGDAIGRWEDTLAMNKYYLPAYEKLRGAHAARGEQEKAASYERQLRDLRRK